MNRFDASEFYNAAGWLYRIEGVAAGLGKESELLKTAVDSDSRKTFLHNFKHLRRHLESIGANMAMMSVDRTMTALRKGNLTYSEVTDRIKTINGRLFDELSLIKLYVFDRSKIEFLDAPSTLFGENVSNSFPSAIPDIEDAGKCIACAQGTAAVFHLMRVMEVGLKALSARLGIPHAPSWDGHLAQITKRISAPHKEKDADWKSIEPFCRDIAGDIQIVKIAWRNPTMHVVRRYSPEEAEAIFGAVKGFMNRLSLELQEQSSDIPSEQA